MNLKAGAELWLIKMRRVLLHPNGFSDELIADRKINSPVGRRNKGLKTVFFRDGHEGTVIVGKSKRVLKSHFELGMRSKAIKGADGAVSECCWCYCWLALGSS